MTGNTLEQRAEWTDTDATLLQAIAHQLRKAGHLVHAQHVERAEAALRLSAGADWQPIETAPKDGSSFLAVSVTLITAADGPCVWHAAFVSGDPWPESVCDGEPLFDATHWMPLPVAPRHEPGEGVP